MYASCEGHKIRLDPRFSSFSSTTGFLPNNHYCAGHSLVPTQLRTTKLRTLRTRTMCCETTEVLRCPHRTQEFVHWEPCHLAGHDDPSDSESDSSTASLPFISGSSEGASITHTSPGQANDVETNRNRSRFLPDGTINPAWLGGIMDYIVNVVGDHPEFTAVRTSPAQLAVSSPERPATEPSHTTAPDSMSTDCPGFNCPNWGRARWVTFQPCNRCFRDVPPEQREESHRRLETEIEGAARPAPAVGPEIPNNHRWAFETPVPDALPPPFNPLTTIPVPDHDTFIANSREFLGINSGPAFMRTVNHYARSLHDLWQPALSQMYTLRLQRQSAAKSASIAQSARRTCSWHSGANALTMLGNTHTTSMPSSISGPTKLRIVTILHSAHAGFNSCF